jgi:hypothetical protein
LLNVQEDSTMKRSITRWTTTLATAALLGLPIAAAAQTQQPSTPPQQQQPAPPTDPQQPQPAQPQPTQPPAQPQPQPTEPQPTQPQPAQPQPTQPPAQPTEPQPTTPPATQQPTASPTASSPDQTVSPEEHLQQARAALSDIKMTSVPARDRAQFNELRRHLSALENPSASRPSGRNTPKGSGAAASASSNSWGTEVAAIDKIITNLAGSDTAGTGTTSTGTTGTSGTSRSRGAASTSIDEATRAKLMEIRTHITAYAAAKAGASSPRNEAASTSTDTMPSAAQSGNATTGDAPRSGNPTSGSTAGQSSSSSTQPAPAQGATTPAQGTPAPAQSAPSAQGNNAGAQDPTAQPGAAAAAAAPKVDTEAAHRSLLAARDALNQLTQLPAAAQLAGETRTQVQSLISNFNELVTNTTDWRTSYAKVSASLATLLGPETGDTQAAATTPAPATAGAPAPAAAGTAGAVGTSGSASVQLDPAIRAKLVEMRTKLNEFEKASGGMEK